MEKNVKIPNKVKVEKWEMFEHYRKCRPFVPNNRNVGAFAKLLGYVLCKQQINGKVYSYYIKKEALETGL